MTNSAVTFKFSQKENKSKGNPQCDGWLSILGTVLQHFMLVSFRANGSAYLIIFVFCVPRSSSVMSEKNYALSASPEMSSFGTVANVPLWIMTSNM